MLDATCKGLFVHPFKKGAVIISFSIYYGTLRNDITNCSGIVIPYYNPKPLTHWSTPEAGSLEPLVSVLPAASVNLTSSRLRRLVLRGYLGFRVSDVGGNFLGFSRANAERMWKYIRQFQFRRMHTDAYKALAKLCSAANS